MDFARSEETRQITELLSRAQTGSREALDELFPFIYRELRRVAERHLANERANHTLQPTALVHETYIRLIDQHSVDWRNRAQFFSIAAETMRRILVNHAIEKKAQKRGSGETLLSLDELSDLEKPSGVDLISLDEALKMLGEVDERQAKIIELRFFGGLTIEETAEVLQISEATVNREWRSAKAWILGQLT